MPYLNTTHLHLLLNHVPTVGTVIGLGLFLLSFVRRNEHLRHASLEVFFLIALATLPAYLTGMAAQEAITGRPEVSAQAIAAHHDGALLAFIFMELTGFVAWLALWQFRRLGRPAGWTSPAILLLAGVTLALMGSAASVGGEIRHPEIMLDESVIAPGGQWLTAAAVQDLVTANPWVWPAAETLHFIGLCLLFGVLFVVNLRLLGGASSGLVRVAAPAAALGHAGVRCQSGDRDAVLYRRSRAVHQQRPVLLEDWLPDGCGRLPPLSDGLRQALGARAGRRCGAAGQGDCGDGHWRVGRRHLRGPHVALPGQCVLMPFVLTVAIVVLIVVALVGAAGVLIDGGAEPRQRNERRGPEA